MFGFTIRPPKGWLTNGRREYNGNVLLVLQMIEPASTGKQRAFVFENMYSPRSVVMKDRLKHAEAQLALELPEPRVDDARELEIEGRPVGCISASYKSFDEERFRLTAMIEIAPRNYLLIRHDGRKEDRAETEALFRGVMESIHFLSKPLTEEQMRRAFRDGAEWIESIQFHDVQSKLMAEQYFVVEVNESPAGAFESYEREANFRQGSQKYEGIEIYQQSWTFSGSAAVRRDQTRIQTDADQEVEKWSTSAVTWTRPAGDAPEQFENAYQEGLRSLDVLISSQASSLSEAVKTNPPMNLPKTYIPRTLAAMLPRLLKDLDKPRTMAFVTFDHELGTLVQKIVEIKGAVSMPTLTDNGPVFRIDDRIGAAAEPTEFYVDAKGRIIMVKSRYSVLRMSTLDDLKKLFDTRIEQSEEAFSRMEKLFRQSESRFLHRR